MRGKLPHPPPLPGNVEKTPLPIWELNISFSIREWKVLSQATQFKCISILSDNYHSQDFFDINQRLKLET